MECNYYISVHIFVTNSLESTDCDKKANTVNTLYFAIPLPIQLKGVEKTTLNFYLKNEFKKILSRPNKTQDATAAYVGKIKSHSPNVKQM